MRYPTFVFLNFFFILTAFILSPFLATLSMITGPILPGFLRYWSTVDDDIDGGQHQQPRQYPSGVHGVALWWQRTCWICRNPAQGWQARVLGVPALGTVLFNEFIQGNPSFDTGNRLYRYEMVTSGGNKYWGYRRDIPVGKSHYIKVWFGWHNEAKDGLYHKLEFQPFGWRKTPEAYQ